MFGDDQSGDTVEEEEEKIGKTFPGSLQHAFDRAAGGGIELTGNSAGFKG